ncbi:MAG TPA: UPF0280 family protein [Candidatus Aminicenantes bacterium]|nr:UPF0280 family protein [Candidatus Aminicenantes bacterium]
MRRHHLEIGPTFATVIAEDRFVPLAITDITERNRELLGYIADHPDFLHALEPVPVGRNAPPIVRAMARAARRAGVGPMAAVAGAIAESALRAMMAAGAVHALVDNGGDIAMILAEPVTVGIFAGDSPIRDLALRFSPGPRVASVCTSSGTVGHSLSFGCADAATVIAGDAALADAVATALGNSVRSLDPEFIGRGMTPLLATGVDGLLVIAGDRLLTLGNLPERVRMPVDPRRASRQIGGGAA